MSAVRCTHTTETASREGHLREDGTWQDGKYNWICNAPVLGFYRQCGAGCKHVIAYCDKHGGDVTAMVEMMAHHKAAHGIMGTPSSEEETES